MEYIKEFAFWNKDDKLGDKILKNLNLLKPEDIRYEYISGGYSGGPKYDFDLSGFHIICKRVSDEHMNFLQGYSLTVDGVELDISAVQSRKIMKKVKEIYEKPAKDDEDFIKKDLSITLEGSQSCEMCGGIVYDDESICDDCVSSEIEIEQPKEKKEVFIDQMPSYPRSQQIYYESVDSPTFRSISYNELEEFTLNNLQIPLYDSEVEYIKNIFDNISEIYKQEYGLYLVDEQYTNEGISVLIEKYTDDYYHVSIIDVSKSGGSWEENPMSAGDDYICDQLQGVRDSINTHYKNYRIDEKN